MWSPCATGPGGLRSIAGAAQACLLATTAAIGFSLTAIAAEQATIRRSGPGTTTLETALIQAYQNNPQLNAQRAATRATDETVPTALSGYRPQIIGASSLTEQYLEYRTRLPSPAGNIYPKTEGAVAVPAAGLTVSQTLYNGFQTTNRTRQAEAQVFAARETLRLAEQSTLLNAAIAYMNLLRDAAILDLQRSNVNVLEVTLRQTRDRFSLGEVTLTDVAQAESSLAAGKSQLAIAQSNYVTSKGQYRQVIGVDPPAKPAAAVPVDRLFPQTFAGAVERGRTQHPFITTAMYNVDVATLQVKVAEGALYPTLSAVGNVQKSLGSTSALAVTESLSASIGAQLTVPLYQGGAEFAVIRQAKETLGQRRLELDAARDQVQATVVQAWSQLDAAKSNVVATQAQVAASETALYGVREEARTGQRTTLDVLNAQQALVNARSALVAARRDRVAASYSVLAAVGGLSPQNLGLATKVYDPIVHYQQVRDAWSGVRIPDGR
jgi:outer membrane protein